MEGAFSRCDPRHLTPQIRGLNTTETVQIHPFDGLERFLELSYQIIAGFHRLTHAVFHDLAHSLPTEVRDYLLAVVESALESDPSFPFSFSHINVLRYFDPAKDMPVNEHTDAYLFTAIALNTCALPLSPLHPLTPIPAPLPPLKLLMLVGGCGVL